MWFPISVAFSSIVLGYTAFAAGMRALGGLIVLFGVSGWLCVYAGYTSAAKIALLLALVGVIASHIHMRRKSIGPFAPKK